MLLTGYVVSRIRFLAVHRPDVVCRMAMGQPDRAWHRGIIFRSRARNRRASPSRVIELCQYRHWCLLDRPDAFDGPDVDRSKTSSMVVDRFSRAPARHRSRPYRDVRRAAGESILIFRNGRGIELSVTDPAGLCDRPTCHARQGWPGVSLFPIAEPERVELARILNETEARVVSVGRSTIIQLLRVLEAQDGFDPRGIDR